MHLYLRQVSTHCARALGCQSYVSCLISPFRGSDRRTNQIWASREDVNTVCFVDDNTNVLASGADDGIVKVSSQREEIDSP